MWEAFVQLQVVFTHFRAVLSDYAYLNNDYFISLKFFIYLFLFISLYPRIWFYFVRQSWSTCPCEVQRVLHLSMSKRRKLSPGEVQALQLSVHSRFPWRQLRNENRCLFWKSMLQRRHLSSRRWLRKNEVMEWRMDDMNTE